MTVAELDRRAQELRDQGLTYREVGRRMGEGSRTAWTRCNRERNRTFVRRWDSANRGRKSAVARRLRRRHSGRHCDRCHRPSDGELCSYCFRERATIRVIIVQRLWARGLTSTQIAARLGWSRDAVTALVHRGRRQGYNFAPRKAT